MRKEHNDFRESDSLTEKQDHLKEDDLKRENERNEVLDALKDSEALKVQAIKDLIGQLFTNKENRELEISELIDREILLISKMQSVDTHMSNILGYPVIFYGTFTENLLRAKFSKNRSSRRELLDALRVFSQPTGEGFNGDFGDKYTKRGIRGFFNRSGNR